MLTFSLPGGPRVSATPDGHAACVWVCKSMHLSPYELHSSYVLMVVPDVAFWCLCRMGQPRALLTGEAQSPRQLGLGLYRLVQSLVGGLEVQIGPSASNMDTLQYHLEFGVELGKSILVETQGVASIPDDHARPVAAKNDNGLGRIASPLEWEHLAVLGELGFAPLLHRVEPVLARSGAG